MERLAGEKFLDSISAGWFEGSRDGGSFCVIFVCDGCSSVSRVSCLF